MSNIEFTFLLVSTFTKGEQMVPVLNRIGVHCACYGNHDFGELYQQFQSLGLFLHLRVYCILYNYQVEQTKLEECSYLSCLHIISCSSLKAVSAIE